MTEKILAAQKFAHEAHDSINQKRKYSGEPYWIHTDAVAALVASVGGTEDMICAAHLHDVIEDVMTVNPHYDIYLIAKLFGETVAKYVTELTDVYTREAWPDLNRVKRKTLERERIAKDSPEAKTIKLADLIDNTKSIVAEDEGFAKTYLKEKLALLGDLSDGNPILLQKAFEQTYEGFAKLGLTIPIVSA